MTVGICLNVHRNLTLQFHQNWVINSRDIAGIEFVWGGGVEGGVVCKVIFVSKFYEHICETLRSFLSKKCNQSTNISN